MTDINRELDMVKVKYRWLVFTIVLERKGYLAAVKAVEDTLTPVERNTRMVSNVSKALELAASKTRVAFERFGEAYRLYNEKKGK